MVADRLAVFNLFSFMLIFQILIPEKKKALESDSMRPQSASMQ